MLFEYRTFKCKLCYIVHWCATVKILKCLHFSALRSLVLGNNNKQENLCQKLFIIVDQENGVTKLLELCFEYSYCSLLGTTPCSSGDKKRKKETGLPKGKCASS